MTHWQMSMLILIVAMGGLSIVIVLAAISTRLGTIARAIDDLDINVTIPKDLK